MRQARAVPTDSTHPTSLTCAGRCTQPTPKASADGSQVQKQRGECNLRLQNRESLIKIAIKTVKCEGIIRTTMKI